MARIKFVQLIGRGIGRSVLLFAIAIGLIFSQIAVASATPLDASVTGVTMQGPGPYMAGTTRQFTVTVRNGSGNLPLDREMYTVTLLVTRPGSGEERIEATALNRPNLGFNQTGEVGFYDVPLGGAVGQLQVNAVIAITDARYVDNVAANNRLAQPVRFALTSLDADVRVASVAVAGAPPYVVGSRRTVTAQIVNSGPSIANEVRVSLEGGPAGALVPIGGIGTNQRNIAVGGNGATFTFQNVLLPAQAGQMWLRATVVHVPTMIGGASVTQNDPGQGDNLSTIAIDVVAAAGPITADLSIPNIHYSPDPATAGQAVTAIVDVANAGPANAQSYRVNLFRRLGNDASWEAAGEANGGPININQPQNVRLQIANVSEGGSSFKAEVTNITDGISEVNGANNRREVSPRIAQPAPTAADLEVLEINFPAGGLHPGENRITVRYKNNGPGAIAEGYVFFSGKDENEVPLVGGGRAIIPSTPSGTAREVGATFTLSAGTSGQFSVEAGVSGNSSSMTDPNTANNTKQRLFPTVVAAGPPVADLSVTNASFLGAVVAGARGTILTEVNNPGAVAIPNVTIYVSYGPDVNDVTTGMLTPNDGFLIASLPAGRSPYRVPTVPLPAAGDYGVGVVLTWSGYNQEPNTDNNNRTFPQRIAAPAGAVPPPAPAPAPAPAPLTWTSPITRANFTAAGNVDPPAVLLGRTLDDIINSRGEPVREDGNLCQNCHHADGPFKYKPNTASVIAPGTTITRSGDATFKWNQVGANGIITRFNATNQLGRGPKPQSLKDVLLRWATGGYRE